MTTTIKGSSQQRKIERAANQTIIQNENMQNVHQIPAEVFEIEKAITDAAMRVKWEKSGK